MKKKKSQKKENQTYGLRVHESDCDISEEEYVTANDLFTEENDSINSLETTIDESTLEERIERKKN